MPSPFLLPSGAYDRSAIMARAWRIARNEVRIAADRRAPSTLRAEFPRALQQAWADARGARDYALWAADQQREHAARQLLDARTREIANLRDARAAANGIDGPRHFQAVAEIDARLAALGAAR